jgi:hypothetical protein
MLLCMCRSSTQASSGGRGNVFVSSFMGVCIYACLHKCTKTQASSGGRGNVFVFFIGGPAYAYVCMRVCISVQRRRLQLEDQLQPTFIG